MESSENSAVPGYFKKKGDERFTLGSVKMSGDDNANGIGK